MNYLMCPNGIIINFGILMLREKIIALYDKAVSWGVEYVPKLALAIIILIAGWWIIKRLVKLTEKGMKAREIDPSLRGFFRTSLSIALKVVLLITVAGMLGIHTTSFVAVLGAAGLAVGLALQGSLSNFAGGTLILFFKPFKVGDVVEIGNYSGEVKEIQIFNTILVTAEHKTVFIPNGSLANGVIVNFSTRGDIRAEIQIKVSAEHNVEKIRAIIFSILESDERILKDPEPQILISSFANDNLTYVIRFFTSVNDKVLIESNTWEKIKAEFAKQEIEDPKNFTFVKNI
ncbi:MAG: mechanosensitive ion channel [Bacteroidia bacterium]|nr:mechanosensitive ion channel [Bacteroidia bacterium]